MTSPQSKTLACLGVVLALAIPASAAAQPGGMGRGGMCCMGGMDDRAQQDMQVFHQLLQHKDAITRQVTMLSNGIESVTRSSDPQIATLLKTHVAAMAARLEEGRPIHTRDPLFAEVFRYAKQMKLTVDPLEDSVHVTETSDDPYAARLIQEHAGVLNLFLERGMSEMHRDHPLPPKP